ncbi:MAG: prepilin peptidase [bacterium]|nr:prepilin peptidase [bacterium]
MMIFFLFLAGAAVGSFLNVIIDRPPRGQTVVRGRSGCDFCHTPLLWWELVPVLGFFLVGGRCRTCHQKLSLQYPLVESITGLVFILIFLYLSSGHPLETSLLAPSFWATYLYWATITSGLLALVTTDLKYGLLPDAVLKPLLFFVLLGGLGRLGWRTAKFFWFLWTEPSGFGRQLSTSHFFWSRVWQLAQPLSISLLIGLAIAGFFAFLIWLTHGRGMGWGDVKLGFLLGLIGGWPIAVVGLFISFLTGAIVGFMLILAGKKSLKETLPFGPFLIFGSVVGLVFGQRIFDWYWQML